MMPLTDVLDQARLLVCVGSGGVGKTTVSAALALEAARRGRKTAVLTVDPSQRLKDALGLGSLGARPRRVPLGALAPSGRSRAHLDAVLLDVKRTFDELVLALATPAQARQILDNRLYQNLSGTLAGTAEYMAVERVYRLVEEGGYELVVVDTPPARHAVDFLDAPRRLLALLESRAFSILKNPASILPAAGSRMAAVVLDAVLRGLERFTGVALVREVGDFVRAIDVMTVGLSERVRAVRAMLSGAGTNLLLVAAPEPRLVDETQALVAALGGAGLAIEGIVLNRSLPPELQAGPADAIPTLDGAPPGLARRLARAHADLVALAARQEAAVVPLVRQAGAPVVGRAPMMPTAPGSLADLAALARLIVPEAEGEPEPARGLGR